MAPSVRVDGALIERLRKERGIEREELAELAGVTAHRMYVIEKRENQTRPKTLRRIALALGVPPQSLAVGEAVGA